MNPPPDIDLTADISEIIVALVRGVVTRPDEVTVRHSLIGNLIALVIRSHPDDVRRVVGSGGKHIKALNEIAKGLAKQLGKTAEVLLDEDKTFTGTRTSRSIAETPKGDMEEVRKLLERTVSMFANRPKAVEVKMTDFGPKIFLEVQVAKGSYTEVMGDPVQFAYGTDGLIIGSIKNLFDGIGKNYGRAVMIVVTKV